MTDFIPTNSQTCRNWRREFHIKKFSPNQGADMVTVRQRNQYKPTVRMFAIPQTPMFEFLDKKGDLPEGVKHWQSASKMPKAAISTSSKNV
jgi:hypothetical protein